ncbi:MAG TPA: hypothetical protein VF701_06360 [Thermoanaerobaculia bacterium]
MQGHPQERGEKRLVLAFLLVLALLTVGRVVYVRSLPGGGHFTKYLFHADRIYAGHFDRETIPTLSPGYLWLMVLLRGPLGLDHWPIRTLQIVMISVAAAAAAAVARRHGGIGAAIVATVVVLGSRTALVNATDFEPESLLSMLSSAAIALVLGGRARPLPGGIAAGLAIITRPVALLLAAVLALLAEGRRRRIAFVAGAAAPVLLIIVVNGMMTGNFAIMAPGTVFYEGMNPRATGSTAAAPRVVKEIEPRLGTPDAAHRAYRVVAAAALDRPLVENDESNRYWSGLALQFLRVDPLAAVRLTTAKVHHLLRAADEWDVPSMSIVERQMASPFWISFALVTPLAAIGVWASRREAGLRLAAVAGAVALPMVLFFVSGRHRSALVVPLAILAGIGVAALWRDFREKRGRVALLLGFVILTAVLLSASDARMMKHEAAEELRALLSEGTASSLTRAKLLAPENDLEVDRAILLAFARRQLAEIEDPARLLAIAVAIDDVGEHEVAQQIFERLGSGFPRGSLLRVSSIEYYHARSRLRSGDEPGARQLASRASRHLRNDSAVLALQATLANDTTARRRLETLFDPFTAGHALAEARIEVCRSDRACLRSVADDLHALEARLPLWERLARTRLRADPAS